VASAGASIERARGKMPRRVYRVKRGHDEKDRERLLRLGTG
jgi:hypothetical protein